VAALKWNGWQHSSGMGGNFEPEYAMVDHHTIIAIRIRFSFPLQEFEMPVKEGNDIIPINILEFD
jgi:hypothetical protein